MVADRVRTAETAAHWLKLWTTEIVEISEIGNNIKLVLNGELKLKGQSYFYKQVESHTCFVAPTEEA